MARNNRVNQFVVTVMVAAICFVFVFYGVFTPSSGVRGDAGSVNGESISAKEFGQALYQRQQVYRQMKFTEAQLKGLGLERQVFDALVRKRLILQEARRRGLIASDEALRQQISEYPAFQKGGKFDVQQYEQVLKSNRYTPAMFERQIKEDLTANLLREYFESLTKVSRSEVEQDFQFSQEKRAFRYVLVTLDAARKNLSISQSDINEYLKDEANLKKVESRFKAGEATRYKGQKWESAKGKIAKEMLSLDRSDEARALAKKVATQVAGRLTSKSASDGAVNRILKPYGVKVKTSPEIDRKSSFVPGLGQAEDLLKDAFALSSPIDPKTGSAKVYELPQGATAVILSKSVSADIARLDDEERVRVRERLYRTKTNEFFGNWLKEARDKASVKVNAEMVPEKKGFEFPG